MKKTFKGILALFLALALLCAAVPAASAQTTSNDGQTFYWDPDTEPWEVMSGSLLSGHVRDTFYLVPSDDVIANAAINLSNYSGYGMSHYPCLEIYDFNDELLYKLDGSTDQVIRYESFMLKGGETYRIEAFQIGYKPFDTSYRITLSKKSDATFPEEPTPTGGGSGYVWNGIETETYQTNYAQDVHYKSTLYYVAQDCTFNLSFNVIAYDPNVEIFLSGPDYYQAYTGSQINTTFTLEAGERFYIAFGADNLPTGFALNVTLTPVA